MASHRILVTGGAGFIGSYTTRTLLEAGYDVVVVDNLSRGQREAVDTRAQFFQADIADKPFFQNLFSEQAIDAVVHFAAMIDVGESVRRPDLYHANNVGGTLALLQAMVEAGIQRFLFSSSAAVFGEPLHLPIDESHPKAPVSPYGRSKLIVEQVLSDLSAASLVQSISLRYFNAAGGDPTANLCALPLRPTNLIPIVLSAILQGRPITIFGDDYPTPDGSCIRDYIHIVDLAEAHLLALQHLLDGNATAEYNLGNGKGFSVKEVLAAIQAVTGREFTVEVGPRRPGDPPVLVANATKAKHELGWTPQRCSLETMVADAWKVHLAKESLLHES